MAGFFGKKVPLGETVRHIKDAYGAGIGIGPSDHAPGAINSVDIQRFINQMTTPQVNVNRRPGGTPLHDTNEAMCGAIGYRMKWDDVMAFPTNHMTCYRDNNKAFVFVVHKGQATVIEDEWGLFPSDALITQLRLLLG